MADTTYKYITLARLDHWIKQLFILPGAVFAYVLIEDISVKTSIIKLILALISTSMVASSNYIINEVLDAEYDKYHPTKKQRTLVMTKLKTKYIVFEYAIFAAGGLAIAYFVSLYVFLAALSLLLMGLLYNVKPIRLKEIPYVDVLSESINNAIRLLIGWFVMTSEYLPPVTIILGFWMGGAYLMAVKRYAEYKMINDKNVAALYRKSFSKYKEETLLISAVFYALTSIFFVGVFMIKYRMELLLAILPICGLYCYYLYIAQKKDSAVQKPEKLFKETGLMVYLLLLFTMMVVLLLVDIPVLSTLNDIALIGVSQ